MTDDSGRLSKDAVIGALATLALLMAAGMTGYVVTQMSGSTEDSIEQRREIRAEVASHAASLARLEERMAHLETRVGKNEQRAAGAILDLLQERVANE